MSITQDLTALTGDAFAACGYDHSLGVVTVADRADLGQFQCNGAFGGAKQYRKAPAAIAGEVIAKLQESDLFADVSFAPPGFINMTLTADALIAYINAIPDIDYARTGDGTAPVVIDFGGANIAKPLHVGHLRPAVFGETFKRLLRKMGYTVIGDTHLGDWGLPMGLVIAELAVRYPDAPCFREDFDPDTDAMIPLTPDLLNEVYPFASQKSKVDKEFFAAAQKATYNLQHGVPGYAALWNEIRRVSTADIKIGYDRLDVSFDLWLGESDAAPYVGKLLDVLNAKNLMKESDGAMIVEVARADDTAPMPPVLIKKSDNSDLYATSDLATIIQRQEDFNPSAIWYLTDNRQELHFTQVFRCARLAEMVPAETELNFFGFGTMNGKDNKPYKTREGTAMSLNNLLDTITDAAREKLESSAYIQSLSAEEKDLAAHKVGLAAIKFGDLVNYRQKDYIFSLEKFLSFEGKTGPYILYMITRIHSILKKAGMDYDTLRPITGVYSDTERELLLKLLTVEDTYRYALQEKSPNFICESAYQIAALFSKFYHENHIMDEPDAAKKASWLALIVLVRRILVDYLDILGIDIVENM